jgi:hypothetical protein
MGCKKQDNSPYAYSNESTIYSDSKTTTFRELVIMIDPYILQGNVKEYIVTDTLRNVKILMNNEPWGMFNSFPLDTSLFTKVNLSGMSVTATPVRYSVIAPYTPSNDTLHTAGEYADLLNNFLTLEPGNYICQVESFEIKLSDGTIKKIKPFIVIPVEVKENNRSALVGEFEVQLNTK